jgi:glutamyl-tRNA synthetase
MMEKMIPARVRFAPSPTGFLHLGGARTALYNYLLARKTGGQFILRIEDTDQKRLVPGAEEQLKSNLRWLGLQWDEGSDTGGDYGPYRQSDRKEIYQKYAQELIEKDNAYYCFCTPERLQQVRTEQQNRKEPPHYDGLCRRLSKQEAHQRVANGERHVIRFKTPKEGKTTVHDYLRGDITVENSAIDDYVLVKSDGFALYHLAVVVDDHLMKITHVFRGAEWLSTFPLHGLITQAFGWEEPTWIHLSIFLKPSGKGKMSKREASEAMKDGHSIFIKDLEGLGYTPEGVVNWVALMGWSYDDKAEFFCMPDLIDKFSIDKLNPSPAAINFPKLDHFNGLHIRNLAISDLAKRIKPFYDAQGLKTDTERLEKIAPIIQERLVTLDEAPEISGFFFKEEVDPNPVDLVAKKLTAQESLDIAKSSLAILSALDQITLQSAEPPLRALVEKLGLSAGQVFGILRVAITGQTISPPLFESMEIIGKEKVLKRVQRAIYLLDELAKKEKA